METKLTLKLDEGLIEAAKSYAKKNQKSVSKLVEDFFKNLVSGSDLSDKYPPPVEKLSGIISEKELERLSMNDERAEYILRKGR